MTPRIYFLLMFIVIFSLFTVCVQSEEITRNYFNKVTSHQLDEPFEIYAGDIAVIENGLFRVMVDEFLQDYRCPVNAECVWAGQARVRVNVNGGLVMLTLGELFESDQNAADLGNGLFLKLL
ncbi:MAG: hypothetical protein GWN14_12865, partial [candidate division Zixibacteria bacterium]|nr:hypothetical protein [Gammaproteobacteria bacterium]NIX56779.1 hypothetical protein [candidate division Zixibacteria bacterium]